MLYTAKTNKERANLYLDAVMRLEESENQEIGYRLVHHSSKAPEYARQQISRYLGYLGHSIPGTEIDSLPLPCDANPDLRFVGYAPTIRLMYTLNNFLHFGLNEPLYGELMRGITWKFTKQSNEALLQTGINLSGLIFSLRAIVLAHRETIDWLLSPQTPPLLEERQPRSLHRSRQTFRDFWGYGQFMDDPVRIRVILQKIQADDLRPILPAEFCPPSFRQFYVRLTSQST